MPNLMPALPALGLLLSGLAVMRLTTPPARVPANAYREIPTVYWPDCVPPAERYERVTVIDPHRTVHLRVIRLARRQGYGHVLDEWTEATP